MARDDNTEVSTDGASSAPQRSRGSRWQVVRFVTLFVLLVSGFLLAYRYAINSEANMWYLYQVARHTAAVLDIAGESASVEPYMRESDPAKVRARIAQWRPGNDASHAGAATLSSEAPLTAYEIWLYKAYGAVSRGESLVDHGPTIQFTARRGLRSEIVALQRGLMDAGLSDAERARIEERLGELQTENSETGPSRNEDRAFTFRIVPDCGAIPSMSIFLAAVVAFPTRWWKKLAGAAAGLAALYGVNVARLAMLGYIGAFDLSPGKKWFDFTHEYVWQGVFILFVVALWMIWVETLVRRRPALA